MTTRLRALDGESIDIYGIDNVEKGTIQMDGSAIKLTGSGAEGNVVIAQGNGLLFEGAAATLGGTTGNPSIISLGNSGDTLSLDVPGVTYAVSTLTGSPIITGNLKVNGTITGSLSGNASTATNVTATAPVDSSANLLYATMAGSDYFRLRVGGASDSGYVEMATANDGTEPIYIRQYTGAFATLTRTAILLDATGNTSFPGTVTATTFSGNLSGSATTADSSARISIPDTRAVADTPVDIQSYSLTAAFKNNTAVGNPPVSNGSAYAHILNMNAWIGANSGGGGHNTQLAFGDGLAIRMSASTSTWGAWKRIIDSGNIGEYSPSLAGVGASGSWAIGITGNAATATKLATSRTISLTGDITGSATFDGSANAYISTTIDSDSHRHNSSAISDATSANIANMIVKRDSSGNFRAGTITASLTGSASLNLPLTGGTITGGLTIEGSISSGATNFGGYREIGTNLILKGDTSGRSGIFFQSEKDGTNINHPSDYGFIQFHAQGLDGITGESNALVIGVANDTNDYVVLQSPYKDGVKISYQDATSGTAMPLYTIWHAGNDGIGSGLDADLLDGNHASAFALSGHTHPYDNYGGWTLKANTDAGTSIASGGVVDIKGGGSTSISRSGSTITISSTDSNTVTTVLSGSKIGVTNTGYAYTVNHATVAAPTSSAGSGRTYITGLTSDGYGHITGYTTASESVIDTNTASAVDNILDGSNSGTAITYAPYAAQQAKLSFDTSATAPTRSDRLNLNGYLYATKLYSGGQEVLTNISHNGSSHTHQKFARITFNAGSSATSYRWTHGLNSANIIFTITPNTSEAHCYYRVVSNTVVDICIDDSPYEAMVLDVTATIAPSITTATV